MITAVVGAGGKTTLIHALAAQFRREGRRVFVTTTTHMYREPDTLVTEDAGLICRQLAETGYVMAGTACAEKIAPLPTEVYEAVCAQADEVLVEADGAKGRAVKFPAAHEPMIPANTERIIVVCGLHGLGRTVAEAAFRQEEVQRCLGVDARTRLTAAHLQTLVQKGYVEPLQERFPNAGIQVYAAGGSTPYEKAVGALLSAGVDVGLIREEQFLTSPDEGPTNRVQ